MFSRLPLIMGFVAFLLCLNAWAEDPNSTDSHSDKAHSKIGKMDLNEDQKSPTVQTTTGVENVKKTGVVINFKPGQGLEIISPDRNFRLTTRLSGELLYTASLFADSADNVQSFQVRRARLIFAGNWFGEHNKFYIHLAFSPKDMQFKRTVSVDENGNRNERYVPTKSPVFDFIFQFDYLRDLSVQMGQYRVPYSLQRRVPYPKLQFVDRSIANFEFNLDRDIGLNIYSLDFLGLDMLRYFAGVFIGEGRDGYQDADFGMLYCARFEVHPLGLFDNRIESDLVRYPSPVFSIGTGYAYLASAKGTRGILGAPPSDGGTTDYHNVTTDVSFKYRGFSIFGDFYYRQGERNYGDATVFNPDTGTVEPAKLEDPRNGVGWNGQVGYLLRKLPLEFALRYSQVLPMGDNTSAPHLDEMGASVTWYIFGASVLLQTDYNHYFENGNFDDYFDQIRVRVVAQF